uniref:FRIGIDA-like protein n=1 Tax=Nelumbo nucifera TaxID=4432 RepID=A0A822YNB8_NELNU|nr:TPA_asm: hypothetical protein HUJ06_004647 [Nelumbo nucifera]
MTKNNSTPSSVPVVKQEIDPAPTQIQSLKQEKEDEPMGTSSPLETQQAGPLALVPAPTRMPTPAAAAATNNEKQENPSFLESINELRVLSSTLTTFKRRWDDLQKHLDSIQTAIDARFKQLGIDNTPQLHQQQPQQVVAPATDARASESLAPDSANSPVGDKTQDSSPSDGTSKNSGSELESLCSTGNRGLRKYIASHLADIAKLREEAPAALKRAANPAKLVLDCIGRFYLQGSKAYTKDSPMVPARQASVFLLEFFLVAGCSENEIEESVKNEAETAAIAWRKRLVNEGGVANANSIDARGLLLFIGSFGVPSVFGNDDLSDLIRLSNPKEIAGALRRSHFLLERVPDIIKTMVKNKMYVEAVEVTWVFAVEEKFPPQTMLTSFLRDSKESWKKTRREAQGSPLQLKEANEKQLAFLKSITKLMEDHQIDPMKFLPGWNINNKIAKLEKENASFDKKIKERAISKRKADEVEPAKKLKTHDVKRPRPTSTLSLQAHLMTMQSQEHGTVGLAHDKVLFDGLTGRNVFSSGFPSMLGGNSGVPVMINDGSPGVSGVVTAHMMGNIAGRGNGLATGTGAGSSLPSSVPFAGVGGSGQTSDRVEQMMSSGFRPYGWYGDGTFNGNSVAQSFTGLPASRERSLLGPYVEPGFLGLQKATTQPLGNQKSGSDIYQFADAVLERESYHIGGPRSNNTMPPADPVSHSSYLHLQ